MTDDELKAIEARANAAQPAQWHHDRTQLWGLVTTRSEGHGHALATMARYGTGDDQQARAEFIAAARSDVPALVAEVRRLRGLVADTQDRNGYQRSHGRGDVCPWCPYGALITAGPKEGEHVEEHIDCPAFTEDGSVR